jgi:NitT/TauT family transport system substrate-binding protein
MGIKNINNLTKALSAGSKVRKALTASAVIGALMVPTAASSAHAAGTALPKLATAPVIRVGYFANLTHGPALIAHQQKLFEKYLGKTKVEYTLFTVGTAEIEALKGGAIDVGFVGPGPAISGYVTTQGSLLRIVGGSASGGAKFIVKPSLISSEGKPTTAEIADLEGKTIADPGIGGTQDIALRKYLKGHNLLNTLGTKVNITPLANADTLTQFKLGNIDGAWVPEPWATRLVQEGRGKVFIDEASLWPKGQFATTVIFAGQKFLKKYPGSVRAVLQANNEAIDYLNQPANQTEAINEVQAELLAATGKKLADPVIAAAWPNLKFTNDPQAASIKQNFIASVHVGVLPNVQTKSLKKIFDLRLLNSLQTAAGKKAIAVPKDLK